MVLTFDEIAFLIGIEAVRHFSFSFGGLMSFTCQNMLSFTFFTSGKEFSLEVLPIPVPNPCSANVVVMDYTCSYLVSFCSLEAVFVSHYL